MTQQLMIGRLAKASKVKVTTIRYYERYGLLMPDSRSDSGYRLYSEETVAQLHFIKNAQHLGFTLDEIKDLLQLQANQYKVECVTMKAKANDKLVIINKKIKALKKMQRALKTLHDRCQGKGPLTHCPIIQALNDIDFEENK